LANIAILVGNTEYRALQTLGCCSEDVSAIQQLLEASKKFDCIEVILNKDSFELKESIRSMIDANKGIQEMFFYFTGHGYQHESDFYFCSTNFDAKRPNETGLSNSELHSLLRIGEADLTVKVIDACSSGNNLVKSDGALLSVSKQGFKNLIQIASCLDSQNSLTGNPISPFTDKFIKAALRKSEGAVYYTDIIDTLRDEYLDNNDQTPHFVSQGTGRERFVDDAHRFDELRMRPSIQTSEEQAPADIALSTSNTQSALEILGRAEQQFANMESAQRFISVLFDKLIQKASQDATTSDLFSSDVVTHSDFQEPTTRIFIARILSGEKRPDSFVTALVVRPRDPFNIYSIAAMLTPEDDATKYELRLNCSVDKAQLKITLWPKFVSLKQLVLVVTCAPSLQVCYVFEMLTQHSLRDWDLYNPEGEEIVRRWYKRDWTDSSDSLADGIWEKIREAAQNSIEAAVQVLHQ